MSPEQVQSTIDDFGIRLRPLVNRCKCGQQISDNRIACKACAMAALKEARAAQ